MTGPGSPPPLDDVLSAFAAEVDAGRVTLERYLRAYPAYAAALVDLSRELSRHIGPDHDPLDEADVAWLDAAWARHRRAGPEVASVAAPAADLTTDPLAELSVTRLREIAQVLDVPRQVVTAFRERRVDVASVPEQFLARFAAALLTTAEQLARALALPPATAAARSYKADLKPTVVPPVSFDRVLADAGVPEARRAALVAGEG